MNKQRPRNDQSVRTTQVPRKPYRTPKLVEYGDLRTITLAKGSNMNDDPTPPATKK